MILNKMNKVVPEKGVYSKKKHGVYYTLLSFNASGPSIISEHAQCAEIGSAVPERQTL